MFSPSGEEGDFLFDFTQFNLCTSIRSKQIFSLFFSFVLRGVNRVSTAMHFTAMQFENLSHHVTCQPESLPDLHQV
ncbi:hypothetical protein ACO0K9_09020 [Undibacterium sp. Ji50W]|uniref:hypothetical protein n=1 Tax=Undibacterium sp. Ji50W TaxID=3413041 RepID=UPI003BF13CBA